jgi:hypothetical protein
MAAATKSLTSLELICSGELLAMADPAQLSVAENNADL